MIEAICTPLLYGIDKLRAFSQNTNATTCCKCTFSFDVLKCRWCERMSIKPTLDCTSMECVKRLWVSTPKGCLHAPSRPQGFSCSPFQSAVESIVKSLI